MSREAFHQREGLSIKWLVIGTAAGTLIPYFITLLVFAPDPGPSDTELWRNCIDLYGLTGGIRSCIDQMYDDRFTTVFYAVLFFAFVGALFGSRTTENKYGAVFAGVGFGLPAALVLGQIVTIF